MCKHVRLGRYVGGQLYCEDCGDWLRLESMGKPAAETTVATPMPRCHAESVCRCGETGHATVVKFEETGLIEGKGPGVYGWGGVDTKCRRCGRHHVLVVVFQVTDAI